jgi:hypothetical protein
MTPRIFQTRIDFTWGEVFACNAVVKNKDKMYAACFFLGMMEAGMFPSLITHICNWHRSDEMGKPIISFRRS